MDPLTDYINRLQSDRDGLPYPNRESPLVTGEYWDTTLDPTSGRTIPYALVVPKECKGKPAEHSLRAIAMHIAETRAMRFMLEDKSRPVDEYQTTTLAAVSEQSITLIPQFERLSVRIEHILITGPSQGSPGAEFEGQATAPAANGIILSVSSSALPPPGNYQLNWKIDLDGTPGAGEVNNVKLVFGSTIVNAAIDGAVGSYQQDPVQFTIPNNNANALQAKAVAAGTAGAIYTAFFDIAPVNGFPVQLQLGDRYFPSLVIGSNGVLEMNPKGMMLSPKDARVLTATFAGDYGLELCGYADERY